MIIQYINGRHWVLSSKKSRRGRPFESKRAAELYKLAERIRRTERAMQKLMGTNDLDAEEKEALFELGHAAMDITRHVDDLQEIDNPSDPGGWRA